MYTVELLGQVLLHYLDLIPSLFTAVSFTQKRPRSSKQLLISTLLFAPHWAFYLQVIGKVDENIKKGKKNNNNSYVYIGKALVT